MKVGDIGGSAVSGHPAALQRRPSAGNTPTAGFGASV